MRFYRQSKQHLAVCVLCAFVIILQSGCAVAQSTTTASPPPTSAAQRPTLDQFGLSNGAFANRSPASTANTEPVAKTTKVEYVDPDIFETVNVFIEKSEFMESELLRVLSDNVDISPSSPFRKYFKHHIEGIMYVSEMQRTGRFGGAGIKNGEVTKLLEQNERTVLEILCVLDAGADEYAQFGKELNGVSEKYGVPLLETTTNGTRLDKPALLKEMMARMNRKYALVKKMMLVKK